VGDDVDDERKKGTAKETRAREVGKDSDLNAHSMIRPMLLSCCKKGMER
jgi:hypothetical protein